MATAAAVVFMHYEKGDGTFNVKIQVYHNHSIKYIDTTHFPAINCDGRDQFQSQTAPIEKLKFASVIINLDL